MKRAQAERRGDERFPLHLPVVVKPMQGNVQEESSLTQDVSAGGAFFYLERKLPEGTPVELLLNLPAELSLTRSIRVRCKGRVVRVVKSAIPGKIGVAAVIEHYDFLPATDPSLP
jgi:hypothetical protein